MSHCKVNHTLNDYILGSLSFYRLKVDNFKLFYFIIVGRLSKESAVFFWKLCIYIEKH